MFDVLLTSGKQYVEGSGRKLVLVPVLEFLFSLPPRSMKDDGMEEVKSFTS